MKKSITKITSILTAAMLAVTPAFQYAPAFYAAESESTEELTDTVKQEVVRRIKAIEKADDDYIYCDISDLNLPESSKQELKDYINELTADDAGMYWMEWCVPLASENKITKVGISLKEKYYQADLKSIDKATARQDYEILQKRLANGELKTILKERLLGDGLEKHTVDVRDLKLYAIDDSVLTELISEDADLYWILEFEFEDDYYLAGTDEEKEKYHLRKIKPTVKEKYQDTSFEYDVNLELARQDFEELQERLKVEGWQQILKERIQNSVQGNTQSTLEFWINIRDLNIQMEAAELEAYIGKLGFTDPYCFAVGDRLSAKSDREGKYIERIALKPYLDYRKEDGSGVDYDKLFQSFYHYRYRISSLTSQMDENMSDVEKTFAVQQWVTRELDYNLECASNLYQMLDDGFAICEYYMVLTTNLLQICDVPVYDIASDSMNHAWNMVKLDGKYYHIDNTWNDGGHITNDEGISGTQYFLRSDERFYNIISPHYDWYCTNLSKTPVSDSEDAFDGYIFRDVEAKNQNTRYSYYKGYWYYFGSNVIYRSKIDGTDKEIVARYGDSGNTIVNLFVYKDRIYLALQDGVYVTDMADFVAGKTDMECVYDVKEDAKLSYIDQFTIKQDALRPGQNGVVTVIPLENQSSLNMKETSMELTVGDVVKGDVDYISESGSEAIWGTDNMDVLEVSADGTITAKAEGTATVYAGVDDCMDKMQVTVTKAADAKDYDKLSEIKNGYTFETDSELGVQTIQGISSDSSVSALKKKFAGANIVIRNAEGRQLENNQMVGSGCTINLLKDGTVVDRAVVLIKGDADGNGEIDVMDMEAIQKDLLGISTLGGIYQKAALVTYNETELSVLDMEAIQKHILGIREIV